MGFYVNVGEVVRRSGLSAHGLCTQIGFASSTMYQWVDVGREPLLFHALYFGRVTGYSLDALVRDGELGKPDIEAEASIPPATKRGCVRFGEAVERAIGSRSLSEVSSATHIARSTFHSWRVGKVSPRLHAVTRLATELEVGLHALALGSVEAPPRRAR